MTKRKSAKHKIDRRVRGNLWGRPKSPFNRRDYGPGVHGQFRKKKLSDYGIQLMAKQRLKGYYGEITERQFKSIYKEAVRLKGDTSENIIELLERRLDAVIYRMKFVPTIFSARQFINHGHILVNGKKVNISSYFVQDNDLIEVKRKSCELPLVLDSIASPERDVPEYVEVDFDKFTGKYLRSAKLADVPYPVKMEPNLVIEFYSR